jgi:hypothetical protein
MNEQDEKPYNPEQVLIEWLLSRTERGRISWKIEDGNITASVSLPPILHVRFDSRVDAVGKHERWCWFSLRGKHGELIQINSNNVLNAEKTVVDAVNALFIAALKSAGRFPGS